MFFEAQGAGATVKMGSPLSKTSTGPGFLNVYCPFTQVKLLWVS